LNYKQKSFFRGFSERNHSLYKFKVLQYNCTGEMLMDLRWGLEIGDWDFARR